MEFITDYFESITNSTTFILMSYVAVLFIMLLWLSTIRWAIQDSQKREDSANLTFAAILITTVLPFLGVLIYTVMRPTETVEEGRIRKMEGVLLHSQLSNGEVCPHCHHHVEKNHKFCTSCGLSLVDSCPSCHKEIKQHWNFCAHCNASLRDDLTVAVGGATSLNPNIGLPAAHTTATDLNTLENEQALPRLMNRIARPTPDSRTSLPSDHSIKRNQDGTIMTESDRSALLNKQQRELLARQQVLGQTKSPTNISNSRNLIKVRPHQTAEGTKTTEMTAAEQQSLQIKDTLITAIYSDMNIVKSDENREISLYEYIRSLDTNQFQSISLDSKEYYLHTLVARKSLRSGENSAGENSKDQEQQYIILKNAKEQEGAKTSVLVCSNLQWNPKQVINQYIMELKKQA